MAKKLWQKTATVSEEVEKFTVGLDREMDLFLAEHDVVGSLAHAKMLKSVGILSDEELKAVTDGLNSILNNIKSGVFTIEEGVEDVHSQVELMLVMSIGEPGKKIHTGRSRNDQVLVDLKLFMRQAIRTLVNQSNEMFETLITLSNKNKNILMPGYTHFQAAMPSSFGLWFGLYAESLTDDMVTLKGAYDIVNRNPLGSAAGFGSSFPLNREMTTELLGFESMNYNSMYAQMSRGKAEAATASAIAAIAYTLSRLAMDNCLYMSQNYGFISYPDEFTTGSSIMPHKKNPDVWELIRARCNRLMSLPATLYGIMGNLPSGYHRDYQIIKENMIPAFEEIGNCLHMAKLMLENVKIREDILKEDKYKYIFSVENVNTEVKKGMSFREAYLKVGMEIENTTFIPDFSINHTHKGSIGDLGNLEIATRMQKLILSFE